MATAIWIVVGIVVVSAVLAVVFYCLYEEYADGFLFPSVLFSIVSVVALVVGGCVIGATEYDQRHCVSFSRQTGLETKYAGGSYASRSCYVKFNGHWITKDRYNGVELGEAGAVTS